MAEKSGAVQGEYVHEGTYPRIERERRSLLGLPSVSACSILRWTAWSWQSSTDARCPCGPGDA